MAKETETDMVVMCLENHWDGQNYFEQDKEYHLAPDYPLPLTTVRRNSKGQILRSQPKFAPVNALARKAFEKLEAEEEKMPEPGAAEQRPIDEVRAIIEDNGLDEEEIAELFKQKKAKKAEDKLAVLTEYMES